MRQMQMCSGHMNKGQKGKTKCKDVSTKVDTHLKLSTTRILSGVAALKKASSLVEAALSGVLYKKIHVPPASVVQ